MTSQYIYLILCNVCVSLAHDRITISPNVEEIIINENDSFTINCTGHFPGVIYPRKAKKIALHHVDYDDEHIQSAVLNIDSAPYGNTGWYGCGNGHEMGQLLNIGYMQLNPDNYKSYSAKWIYLYVNSTTSHLTEYSDEIQFVHAKHGDDIILPCRPTSPEYNITLFREGRKAKPHKRVSYDPKRGFLIKNATRGDSDYYQCVSDIKSQELKFVVDVLEKAFLPREPDIQYSVENLVHNKELRLNCSIEKDSFFNSAILWEIPNKNAEVSKETHIDSTEIMTKEIVELKIRNFTQSDEGLYICRVLIPLNKYTVSKNITIDGAAVEYRKVDATQVAEQISISKNSTSSTRKHAPATANSLP